MLVYVFYYQYKFLKIYQLYLSSSNDKAVQELEDQKAKLTSVVFV